MSDADLENPAKSEALGVGGGKQANMCGYRKTNKN